jgi:Flp pilus assembly protein TadD
MGALRTRGSKLLLAYAALALALEPSRAWGAHLGAAIQDQEPPAPPAENSGSDASGLQQARIYLNTGSWAQAEAAVRAVLAAGPSAEAYEMLGYALYREGRASDSLAAYTSEARLRTPGPQTLKAVAFDYILLGAYADADKWLTRVVQLTPADADSWYFLGRTKYNENRFADAVAAFETSLKLQPGSVRAENNLGLAYEGLNRDAEAEAAFRSAIKWQAGEAKQSEQPYLNLGMLQMHRGQLTAALPNLETAAALAPRNPKVQEQLGRAYQQAGQPKQAQLALQRAVALAPEVAQLHFQLGIVYRQEGKREEAKHEFERCAELNGSHSTKETPNPVDH